MSLGIGFEREVIGHLGTSTFSLRSARAGGRADGNSARLASRESGIPPPRNKLHGLHMVPLSSIRHGIELSFMKSNDVFTSSIHLVGATRWSSIIGMSLEIGFWREKSSVTRETSTFSLRSARAGGRADGNSARLASRRKWNSLPL
ncbi:hypothetical protein CDAR_24561 [Caerostris darwini]|uniref:Uncharacterized protein n=1 Tax=Caerostris darwini TaxID=1538125 RepID=A0AAV4SFF2_9ARAC|nr:hypothetical protein CDAR_24561 [Caerostris darwini]